MWVLVASIMWLALVRAQLPPSCESQVYCQGDVLHYIQAAKLYNDSKTFVDMKMLQSENETVAKFQNLLNETSRAPTKEQIQTFVAENFAVGDELEDWTPTDYAADPTFLSGIKDEKLRQFGKDVNAIWPKLGRKLKPEILENPDQYSFIPVTNGFVIPGGRFKEIYYWDSFWIIEGLIICGMKDTARGMIENLMQLVKKLGHVPNGSRWYYQQRSQPPLLTPMAALYYKATQDKEWLKSNIDVLEEELNYWLNSQTIEVEQNDRKYTLLRYYAPSEGPRPESYNEDLEAAQVFSDDNRKQEFYTDIKSAAASGWDFSSRWFIDNNNTNTGNLSNIHTTRIIPVDLNGMFAGALKTFGDFKAIVGDRIGAAEWWLRARYWRDAIDAILWDQNDGIWYDYDSVARIHRKYFYPSNLTPLWAGAVEVQKVWVYAPKIQSYLVKSKGLSYPGGVPTSLSRTGEQWDFPNGWPPLVSITVGSLEKLGTKRSRRWAKELAQTWVQSNYLGFQSSKQMFEKYDVEVLGQVGGGGEYVVQEGFGWSNGVVFEFMKKYGGVIKAEADAK